MRVLVMLCILTFVGSVYATEHQKLFCTETEPKITLRLNQSIRLPAGRTFLCIGGVVDTDDCVLVLETLPQDLSFTFTTDAHVIESGVDVSKQQAQVEGVTEDK